MFDNPREELKRLQEELLAAEEPAEEPEEEFPDPELWEEDDRQPLSRSYTDAAPEEWLEELEEEEEIEDKTPPVKHYNGLKYIIALELLALASLVWWWYLWIR